MGSCPPLSTWLRAQMMDRGLRQPALAARAGTGLGTLNDVLRQGHVPRAETLFRLAGALGTSHLDILQTIADLSSRPRNHLVGGAVAAEAQPPGHARGKENPW